MTHQKDDLLSGLVKVMDFKNPGPDTDAQFNTVKEALEHFHERTPNVFRFEGITNPIVDEHPLNKLATTCINAAKHIFRLIDSDQRNFFDKAFTVMDSTPYLNLPVTEKMGTDLIFTNVFWNQGYIYLAFMMGQRRWHIVNRVWAEEDLSKRHCAFLRVERFGSLAELGFMIKSALIKHVPNPVMNQMYGDMVVDAINQVMKPTAACEFPVAAATYLNDKVYWVDRPYRHHHIVQSAEFQAARENCGENPIQGFLTNHRNFVTRRRALHQVADKGMIRSDVKLTNVTEYLADCTKDEREGDMGGILSLLDYGPKGYQVSASSGLFSEDLW